MTLRVKAIGKKTWAPSAVPFFLFGFFYYLVAPVFALRFLVEDNDLLYAATKYVDLNYFDGYYFLDSIIILVSFLVGYFFAISGTNARTSVLDRGQVRTSGPLLLAIMFNILIVYVYATASASGVQFFTGYSAYNILVLGPLSTCAFMSAWFVNYFLINKIRFLFLSVYIFSSILLLGLGSRMHFVLGFMALIIGLVAKNKRLLKSAPFYIAITVSCLLVIAVGVAREGGREFSSDNLMAVFFAESLFSSLSGAVYLENSGGRPVYGIPSDLFASIINFVPSPIYPEKIQLMAELTYNKDQGSPFGGRSLIANVYPNFGYFYPLYIGLIGCYYGYLYKRAHRSGFYRAVYFSALPMLVFFFYREPLFTLVKVMFFNGLLVPFIISLLFSYRMRNRRPATDDGTTLSRP